MQKESYAEAEVAYRRALLIGPDNNKMCNLGICLMKQGRVAEAKETLERVRPAVADGPRGVDSHLKAFERAQEMLRDLQSRTTAAAAAGLRWPEGSAGGGCFFFPASSAVWRPLQPGIGSDPAFGDENAAEVALNNGRRAVAPPGKAAEQAYPRKPLTAAPPPFYPKQRARKPEEEEEAHRRLFLQDPLGNLKRTRSAGAAEKAEDWFAVAAEQTRRSLEMTLPDEEAFDESIVAAVLAPVLEAAAAAETPPAANSSCPPPPAGGGGVVLAGRKVGKRLRVFQDITTLSPKA